MVGVWKTESCVIIRNLFFCFSVVSKNCSLPPMIVHGSYRVYSIDDAYSDSVPEGSMVGYFCATGYT